MADRLANKTVVVIGGSSGIGLAVAKGALDAGARVIIASSQADKVEAAAKGLGAGAEGRALDVLDEAAVAAFFETVGAFDHLAYTAGDWGRARRGGLAQVALPDAADIFKVRFWGAVAAAKHAAPHLAAGGSITLTDGMIAHRPRRGSAVSTAMAGAVEHLTQGLAVELAPIRVNCVCPGLVRTPVWDSIPEADREARLAEMTRRQLVPRAGEAGELAEAYLFLMRCGYVTGQVLQVDGGSALA